MIDSKTNKKAWEIRRKAAKNLGCKVLEISWKHCLKLAKSLNLNDVNKAVSSLKHFDSITELIRFCNEKKAYPVLNGSNHPGIEIIKNYFDTIMILAGDKRRVKIV